jgi:hypothetical protein
VRPTVLAILLSIGCGRIGFSPLTSDAGPSIRALDEINSAADEDDPTVTEDLLEMYLNRSSRIWRTTRLVRSDPWGPLALVAELTDTGNESNPEVALDGLSLSFGSTRVASGHDILGATRGERPGVWTVGEIVELSTSSIEVALVTDRSMRHGVLERFNGVHFDLLSTTRLDVAAPWTAPVPIAELNTPSNDESPFLSADGLTLYFESDRPGSLGRDIYAAWRPAPTAPFEPPTRFEPLSSDGNDADPWVSPDGSHALLARGESDRDIFEAILE